MHTKEAIWAEFCRLCKKHDTEAMPEELLPPVFTLDASRPFSHAESVWFQCQKRPGRYAEMPLDCQSSLGRLSFFVQDGPWVRPIPEPHTMPGTAKD